MRVTIWGCRGSVPTPGPETVEYGGNTSCVEVTLDDGTVLIFDAGTGIRGLGAELAERGARRSSCCSHLHLDHLEGLRFFAPLWDEAVKVDVWGPPSTVLSLQERIARSFSPPLFPIDLRDVPAELSFHDIPSTLDNRRSDSEGAPSHPSGTDRRLSSRRRRGESGVRPRP